MQTYESLFAVTVDQRTHRSVRQWHNPGTNGRAHMVLTACDSMLYPRTYPPTVNDLLHVKIGDVDCPDCIRA